MVLVSGAGLGCKITRSGHFIATPMVPNVPMVLVVMERMANRCDCWIFSVPLVISVSSGR